MATTYTAATVVTPAGSLSPGWVSVEDGHVQALGSGRPSRVAADVRDLGDATVVPGFVDMHAHGGGGAAFTDGPEEAERVLAAHVEHGTTSMVASLVSDSLDALETQVRGLAPLVTDGNLLGVHLEGPWLSNKYAGAHDRSMLRDPAEADIVRLLGAAPGAVAMVTLAAERSGGPAAVRRLVDEGVVVALGHSDASYEEAHRAIDAGATVATHLFNAARPIHHREPGLTIALLERDEVTVGSTLTLDRALRFAVQVAGLDLAAACHAVSTAPADALHRTDLGRIAPGARADIVALDGGLEMVAVMRNGAWVVGDPLAQDLPNSGG